MKYIIVLNLFIISSLSYSQNFKISKIVVDINTKSPLENVIIFNESDYSGTNADGKFIFVSQKNEVNFDLLGYEGLKTTFDDLKNTKDTIFMQLKATQLQEVVVNNTASFMKKAYEKSKDNFLQDYTINFFLRSTFKKDTITTVLQDIYGKRNLNTANKKMTSIEILNMRKIKILEKKEQTDFQFPDFNTLFNIVAPQFERCAFTEIPFSDSNYKKILFETNEKDSKGQIWKGYFIINRNDYATVEYNLIWISDPEKVPYEKKNASNGQYRTVKWNKLVQFTKDIVSNKYYPTNSKFESKIEVLIDGDDKAIYFDCNMDYFVAKNPTNEDIKSNFSADKDIFKAKFPYSKDFWDNQNQLPLTKELELFLKSINEKKDKTKEFEIIGNF
jgi:hypothetical protein